MFESLESRTLLSASLKDGLLLLEGTQGDDSIVLKQDAGRIVVRINKAQKSYLRSAVSAVEIRGLGGDDRIEARTLSVGCIIKGGNGHDTIYGSKTQDRIDGGGDGDSLYGLAGDDDFTVDPKAADRLFGGAGNDYTNRRGQTNDSIEGVGLRVISLTVGNPTMYVPSFGAGTLTLGGVTKIDYVAPTMINYVAPTVPSGTLQIHTRPTIGGAGCVTLSGSNSATGVIGRLSLINPSGLSISKPSGASLKLSQDNAVVFQAELQPGLTIADGIASAVLRVSTSNPGWTFTSPQVVRTGNTVQAELAFTKPSETGGEPVEIDVPVELGVLEPGTYTVRINLGLRSGTMTFFNLLSRAITVIREGTLQPEPVGSNAGSSTNAANNATSGTLAAVFGDHSLGNFITLG